MNVKRFAVIGGHPNDFTNNTEMNCTIIGFGQLPKNMSDNPYAGIIGYLNTVKVKYGKDACVKVLLNQYVLNITNIIIYSSNYNNINDTFIENNINENFYFYFDQKLPKNIIKTLFYHLEILY